MGSNLVLIVFLVVVILFFLLLVIIIFLFFFVFVHALVDGFAFAFTLGGCGAADGGGGVHLAVACIRDDFPVDFGAC